MKDERLAWRMNAPRKSSLAFYSFHILRDGYGYGSCRISEALQRIDPTIEIVDMRESENKHGRVGERSWHSAKTVIALCTPDWLPYIHADRLIAFSMFEATKLPDGWVELLNTYASEVIVPCAWNADVFKANGVMPKISVCKWGVDARDDYPLDGTRASMGERESGRPYTFLWSGTPDRRKGWDVAYRAFWQAFQGSPQARLILHFRQMPDVLAERGADDANVEIVTGLLDVAEQRALLRRADCYVFPSRGEGWGSPPREAAATGLPVIVTNWGGLAEDIDYWAMPVRVRGMSPAQYGYWGDGTIGEWAEPNLDDVAERMRWCFEQRASAAYFGRQAATWLARYATWEQTARRLLDASEWAVSSKQ